MKSNDIRERYLKFFEERGHKRIKPSPLVLEGDDTTLFTSAGMQQLTPYLKGKKHPKGKRLVNSQPSFRTQDIDEVGDNRHTTFFEMLGNWSLGDYFKKEQLSWIWEFFTKDLDLSKDRLWVTVFEGTKEVPKDEESAETWKDLGVAEKRIHYYGVKENWWSITGPPNKMSQGDIGGPDSEVFFEFTQVKHDKKFGKKCHPNCQCGRFLEIGNSVFIEYVKKEDGSLEELPQKSVDFGGGLERIAAAVADNPDIFRTDAYKRIISEISAQTERSYEGNEVNFRIIADHMRAAVFLVAEGLKPGNKLQGYVLRRLIRRATFKLHQLDTPPLKAIPDIVNRVLRNQKVSLRIHPFIGFEAERFLQTLDSGMKYLIGQPKIDARIAFNSLATYGIPFEVTNEYATTQGQRIDRKEFEEELKKHKKLSQVSSAGTFKGGLVDDSPDTIKLHTATHLLHWALREVLGDSVRQEGSNITSKRLRFDYSHDKKLSDNDLKRVEGLINEKIKDNLVVHKTIEDKEEALKSGALAFFKETYPEKVSIYTIGKDPKGDFFSKEFCGGPHVKRTSEIGRVKITKQKKIGASLMRVYAELEN